MRSQSFIGELLVRNPARCGSWPGENLLTGATAAVLRRVPWVAADLLAKMLGESGPESGPAPHVDALGTAPERRKALVYLTRTGATPPNVLEASAWRWPDVAKVISDSRQDHAGQLDAVQLWLLDDYLLYLKERGLAVTEALEPSFVTVMHDFKATAEKLLMLRKMVTDRLSDAGWTKGSEGFAKTASDWDDLWVAYEPRPESAYTADCAFDWGILDLTSGQEPVVITGLWFGDNWDRDAHGAWIDEMTGASGTQPHMPFRDPAAFANERLCRSRPFADLPNGQLADQAEAIATFVLETFNLLATSPPKAS